MNRQLLSIGITVIVMLFFVQPTKAQVTSDFTMRVVATGFSYPWEITYGPDNYLWVTERTGKRIVRVNPANGAKQTLIDLSSAVAQNYGQDGLLGLALHPQLLTDSPFVYTAYTYLAGGIRRTKIVRLTYNQNPANPSLGSSVTLIDNLTASDDHNSGRLKFGPDGKLYYTIGDMGNNQFGNKCKTIQAQTLPTQAQIDAKNWVAYQGKILRLNTDGTIPDDNPTINGVRSHIYSYGHRNPQGIAFTPDGKLFASEHGPRSDDEINGILAGKNYGWPLIAGYQDDKKYKYVNWSSATGNNCNTTPYSEDGVPGGATVLTETESSPIDFTEPVFTFFTVATNYVFNNNYLLWPTIAPSSLDIYTKTAGGIPGWDHSMLVTSLKHGKVYVVKMNNSYSVALSDTISFGYTHNRYRDIAIDPSQLKFYVVTDNDGGTSGPTSGVTSGPLSNPGAILEFTYTGELLAIGDKEETPRPVRRDEIRVYPVPANGSLTVDINSSLRRPYTYELFDIAGRKLISGVSGRNLFEISLNGINAGAYFLRVTTANGQQLPIQKVIKR